jgi:hypothetical protein
MRHPLRRGLAAFAAAAALVVGAGATPASADAYQGANRFGNAPTLPAAGGVFRGTTEGATLQPGEPEHPDNIGGASVWFNWRPSASGTARITTRGSDFDTLLAVYRGPDLVHLQLVRANDDTPESDFLWSRVQFPAQAGVTYRIQLDGYNSDGTNPPPVERGNYVLRITRP